jgi:hypothetical protein
MFLPSYFTQRRKERKERKNLLVFLAAWRLCVRSLEPPEWLASLYHAPPVLSRRMAIGELLTSP